MNCRGRKTTVTFLVAEGREPSGFTYEIAVYWIVATGRLAPTPLTSKNRLSVRLNHQENFPFLVAEGREPSGVTCELAMY
jgi:hypothetical protein